jgi:hypothetical protein
VKLPPIPRGTPALAREATSGSRALLFGTQRLFGRRRVRDPIEGGTLGERMGRAVGLSPVRRNPRVRVLQRKRQARVRPRGPVPGLRSRPLEHRRELPREAGRPGPPRRPAPAASTHRLTYRRRMAQRVDAPSSFGFALQGPTRPCQARGGTVRTDLLASSLIVKGTGGRQTRIFAMDGSVTTRYFSRRELTAHEFGPESTQRSQRLVPDPVQSRGQDVDG